MVQYINKAAWQDAELKEEILNEISGGEIEITASAVNVAEGDDGLDEGNLQITLQALATRIQALEDAAV